MSIGKFNELGNAAMNRIAPGDAAGSTNPNAAQSSAQPASPGINRGAGPGAKPAPLSAAGIDWFSQLDTGTAHPMRASNRFGTNPPIDSIVDSIMSNLGLPPRA